MNPLFALQLYELLIRVCRDFELLRLRTTGARMESSVSMFVTFSFPPDATDDH